MAAVTRAAAARAVAARAVAARAVAARAPAARALVARVLQYLTKSLHPYVATALSHAVLERISTQSRG